MCWGNRSLLLRTVRLKWQELGARFLENLLLDPLISLLLLQNVEQVASAASCGLCADLQF